MLGRSRGGASNGSLEALERLDAVAQVGLRIARSAPSGRVLLAQLALGVDPRWIPRPWGEELIAEMDAARRASTEPLSARRLEQSLRDAWGRKPGGELDELDPEPVAVTPTSQVHRGVLDGAPVAVKVQRPGLARSVRGDLALRDSLVVPLSAAFPALDARAALREVAERTREEFDLEHEAANARRLHRELRGHPRLHVPAPVTRLAGEDVLVREWVEGRPVTEADQRTRDEAAAALVAFVLGGGARGMMPAGLTADDVLVGDDGRVAIVDHGVCCDLDRARVGPTLAALQALIADDREGGAAALGELGWLDRVHAPDALTLAREVLGDLLGASAVTLDVDAVRDVGLRIVPRRAAVLALMRAGAPAPADLWPLRGVAQLFGTHGHPARVVDPVRWPTQPKTSHSWAKRSSSRSPRSDARACRCRCPCGSLPAPMVTASSSSRPRCAAGR